MKRFIFYAVLAVISLNVYCAVIDYTMINPQTLPVYSGSLSDPNVRTIYEDPNGINLFIEYEGVLYVIYL